MPRFFLPPEAFCSGCLDLTGEHAAHARVLRLKPGDSVLLCDGAGMEYPATVTAVSADRIALSAGPAVPSTAEPTLQASIFMAFPKADKLEHVIQKATELGAREIVAFPSARCVSRPDPKSLPKKLARWQKIAASAAEQSGRGSIPQISAAATFEEALGMAAQKDLALFLYEGEHQTSFRSLVGSSPVASAAIMTGPEGGFEAAEAAAASRAGLSVCTLGPRILRCETAPLCALSALMFAAGELD